MNAAYLVCCSWISRNSDSQTLCSWQHSYSSFVQSWKGLEVKSYWICLRSLKSTGFLYWVFKSPWNSIPCLLHTVFCEIRLSHRGKFGSSLVWEPVKLMGNLIVTTFLCINNIIFISVSLFQMLFLYLRCNFKSYPVVAKCCHGKLYGWRSKNGKWLHSSKRG